MLSIIVSALIINLIKKIGRGSNALTRAYIHLTRWLGAIFVAIEGHLICRYVYPILYPLFPIIERHTGINLEGFKYD